MPRYLIGVASSRELADTKTTESYWCVPADTEKGDIILLYCPRAVSAARQGVFAECVVTTAPSNNNEKNCLCSGYGFGNTSLRYVSIKITQRFKSTVTAKDMKSDAVLMSAGFVRKNFQGTNFSLTESMYRRIIELAEKKDKTNTLKVPLHEKNAALAEWPSGKAAINTLANRKTR